MFITPNMTVFGGIGFSVGGDGGVLKTASGYPLTLTKTLAKPPENITVYGASGGVGEATANLLPDLTIGVVISSTNGKESSNSQAASSPFIPVDFTQNSYYTISGLVNTLWSFVAAYDSDKKFVGRTGASARKNISFKKSNFTSGTPASSNEPAYIRLCQLENVSASGTIDLVASAKIMLNTGSTALPYEPYGYKIPVQMTTAEDTSTVNIYSDAQLGDGDVLTVTPKKSAMRNDTDVSALQDWTQDWKLPKSEELTVTAGTEVEPSNMEIRYYGKR